MGTIVYLALALSLSFSGVLPFGAVVLYTTFHNIGLIFRQLLNDYRC